MHDSRDGCVGFVYSPNGHLGPSRAAVAERTGGSSLHPFASLNVGRSTDDDPEAVRANEQIILRSLGLADRVARLRLEHGARVVRPDGPGMYGPADALLTDDPALVLWFTVADCVPVTITAGLWRAHGHCGWRGVAAGLVEAMVAAVTDAAGVSPAGLRAWAGPGIGVCCFEVGADVAARFHPAVLRVASSTSGERPGDGASPPGIASYGSGVPEREALLSLEDVAPREATAPSPGAPPRGRVSLDLRAEIALRLAKLGLPSDAVAVDGSCTACGQERFFSHRRDGVPTGRMAAISYTC